MGGRIASPVVLRIRARGWPPGDGCARRGQPAAGADPPSQSIAPSAATSPLAKQAVSR